MALTFYYVDKDYINYLQLVEIKARGFSRVPNMEYPNREQKFMCGIVLNIRGKRYYVPVSSYKIQQDDNILIKVPTDRTPIKSSLRFNYMIPVPDAYITELVISKENSKRRILLNKELDFILKNETIIKNKAKQTYSKVVNKVNDKLVRNSCDFRLLEKACEEWEKLKKKEILEEAEGRVEKNTFSNRKSGSAPFHKRNHLHIIDTAKIPICFRTDTYSAKLKKVKLQNRLK